VGHETDFTIADFVADLRAPTPTAAAELAVPDQADLRLELAELGQRLNRSIQGFASELRWAFNTIYNQLERNSPLVQIQSASQRVDELDHLLGATTNHMLQLMSTHLRGLSQHLAALNPSAVLERGFAIVTNQAGETIARVGQVSAGEPLNVQVSDGDFGVHVDSQ
jgi:exodeoxyribonuclease VII large subunit